MAQKTINELKSFFNAGDRPTEEQFKDLIDSYLHLSDPRLERLIENIDVEGGYLKLKSSEGTLVTQVSLDHFGNKLTESNVFITALQNQLPPAPVQSVNGFTGDVVINTGGTTDRGSSREGFVKYFTTENGGTDYFHIKLPYKVNTDSKMYHIKASGYAYNSAAIIDVIWVGYCYYPQNNIIRTDTNVSRSTTITAGQYVGTNNHVYLWFKVPNTYYTTFRLDCMYVGNGELLEEGDVEIIKSPNATL